MEPSPEIARLVPEELKVKVERVPQVELEIEIESMSKEEEFAASRASAAHASRA